MSPSPTLLLVFLLFPHLAFSQIDGPQPLPSPTPAPPCALKLQQPDARKLRPLFPSPAAPHHLEQARGKGGSPCTPEEFAALSGSDFANAVAEASDSCLYPLWTYGSTVRQVLDGDRITAVLDLMDQQNTDPVTNASTLKQMLYFLQIAFYHEWYQTDLNYSGTLSERAATSVAGVGNATGFDTESGAMNELRYQWSITIDSTAGTHLATNIIFVLIERFHRNPALAADWYERAAAFNYFFTLSRQVAIGNGLGANNPWLNLITPEQLALVREIATYTEYDENTESIVNNAIYALGNFSVLDEATATAAHEAISAAYNTQTRYTGPWFRALQDIDNYYNGMLADGTELDMETVRAEAKAFALPNRYVFDDGKLIFETAISREKAELLYDAMQEVEAQFFRKTTFLDPTPGDDNAILTLVVYGSPADYETFQPFLYNLSTDNGGIFIESWATLFTYDRTPQDSYLSLEELLRHEYVHYLDGRHVVVPEFGDGSMYQNGRLDWYAEGLAEFLAGATRTEGVLPRRIYVDIIGTDSQRMTVSEIVYATYSTGWKFYRYGGLLFNYMDAERPELLVELFNSIRANDPGPVDALYAQMANDSAMQTAYDAFLDTQVAGLNDGETVFAEDVPTSRTPTDLPLNNADQIRETLETEVTVDILDFTVWTGRYQASFETSMPTNGDDEATIRDRFEAHMDQILADLADNGLNFTTAASWFGNLDTAGDTVTASCRIEGPFAEESEFAPPIISPASIAQGLRPVTLRAIMPNVPSWTWSWYMIDGSGQPMGQDELEITFDTLFEESTWVELVVSDTQSGAEYRARAIVLVPMDDRYVDANGDGCNTMADLHSLLPEWGLTGPDPNGNNLMEILDYLYINTQDTVCP
ncbi:Microbial collagenase [Sulfidibacter corallicola]|uniref:microbial collagenase n=1 Tax=Sulfidibacter corallicola TaxID=2818388 RepID=A0A8A4TLF5_SULCO|nr:collagenase [Sulfidibacter corallicola]QTD50307.1 collagenase [Sulfidibacter corallicola]